MGPRIALIPTFSTTSQAFSIKKVPNQDEVRMNYSIGPGGAAHYYFWQEPGPENIPTNVTTLANTQAPSVTNALSLPL